MKQCVALLRSLVFVDYILNGDGVVDEPMQEAIDNHDAAAVTVSYIYYTCCPHDADSHAAAM
jgi:hypothetical protein